MKFVVICAAVLLVCEIEVAAGGATYSQNDTSLVGRWIDPASDANVLSGMDFVVMADNQTDDISIELSDLRTQSIVYRLEVSDGSRIRFQWYDVSVSFDVLATTTSADAVDSDDAEGAALALAHYLHAVNQFCTGPHGRALLATSDWLFRTGGLSGGEHRPALALHIVAQRCLQPIRTAAKRSGGELGDAFGSIDMSRTCPNWPNGAQPDVCTYKGQFLTAAQCNSECVSACGPSCTCWPALCGDCCSHPGCQAHDVFCRSSGPINFAKCMAGYGCLWSAPDGCC